MKDLYMLLSKRTTQPLTLIPPSLFHTLFLSTSATHSNLQADNPPNSMNSSTKIVVIPQNLRSADFF